MRPTALALGVGVVVLGAWACGGTTAVSNDAGADGASSSSSGGSSGGSGGSSGGSSSGSGSGSGSSSSGGHVPVNHRPSDAQCTTTAPPGDCSFDNPGAACHSDADCSEAGSSGRCIVPNGPPTCFCTWDSCTGDSECKTGQTCACHGSAYTAGVGNTCAPGNCRVDADCGSGGYCSPSAATNTCGTLSGYYCHTPKDQCTNDSDCGSSAPGNMCIYSPSTGYWSCQQSGLCAG
jgi:hypothetical protein